MSTKLRPTKKASPPARCAPASNRMRSTARWCRRSICRRISPSRDTASRASTTTPAPAIRPAISWAGALADLEGGAGAVVTCTGLSAITLILATLPAGARVVAPYDCYGGTYRLLAALHAQGKLVVDFIDQGDAGGIASRRSRRGAALVWIETPSNPLLRVVDIRAVADAAHAAGALAVVDNTFLSPLWQQPLALGADLVMHSTTKYLNGHSDVVGGAVIAATAELHDKSCLVGQCHRRHRRAVRQLHDPARRAHAACAHARACREHRRGRRFPDAASRRGARVLSGSARSSGP